MAVQPMISRPEASLGVSPTVPNIIHRAAEQFGAREFLVEGDRRLSFEAGERESAALARGLLALGLGKGARIGLMMPNGADWVLNWMAASRMGALVVCLSSFFQVREIDWALRHNDIDTLFISAEYLNHDYLDRLERALPGLADHKDPVLLLRSHPYLRRIVVWGDCDRPWALHGPHDILEAGRARPAIDDAFLAQAEAQVTPADDATVICTSGTTAEPKAVVHTHGSVIRPTWAFTPVLGIVAEDRILNAMPFFWVGGFLRAIMPALFEGATLLFGPNDAGELLDFVLAERPTFMNLTAGVAYPLRGEIQRRQPDLSFIRDGFGPTRDAVTGELIPPERRVPGQLGMTETFGTHSGETHLAPAPLGKEGNWGRPAPGVERRIVDPETGAVLGTGQEGELQLRGSTLMRGYYKRELSQVFTADGFFATGDKCLIDEDDYLFFRGRLNEMIKTSGANVAPREVEVVLNSFPEVRESIVFGVPDARRGQAVVAVIVAEEGATIDEDALRGKVRAEISSYKAPSLMVVMDGADIPRTDSGKVKKNELRDRILARPATARPAEAESGAA